MGKRFRQLLVMAVVFGAIVSLVVFISQDKKRTKQQKLQANLRLTGIVPLSEAPVAAVADTDFDFGTLDVLQEITHRFPIENVGHAPLKLAITHTTCKCTHATLGKERLLPGESTEVAMTFTAKGLEGKVYEGVDLKTNDPVSRLVSLRLTGQVRKTLWLEPKEVKFSDVLPGDQPVQEVHILSPTEEAFSVENINGDRSHLEWTLLSASNAILATNGARSGYTLQLKCIATSKLEASQLTFDVVKSESGTRSTQSLPYHISRVAKLSISGAELNILGELELGNVPLGEGREVVMLVKARGDSKRIRLNTPEVLPSFLKVWLEPRDDSDRTGLYKLHVQIPADAPEGSYTGEDEGKIVLDFASEEYPPMTLRPRFTITKD